MNSNPTQNDCVIGHQIGRYDKTGTYKYRILQKLVIASPTAPNHGHNGDESHREMQTKGGGFAYAENSKIGSK